MHMSSDFFWPIDDLSKTNVALHSVKLSLKNECFTAVSKPVAMCPMRK